MIEQFFQSLLPSIEHLHSVAYWLAFAMAFAETALVVGLVVPGSTLLLLLGALAATGQIDFAGVFWFGVAGAVLGDNLNYWLGKRYGQRWIKTGVWILKPEHFEQAHNFFDRKGAKSVFLGRFIPSIKEIVPFVAGSVGMHQGTFLFWNLLGGIGWGLQWIGGGYLFGQSLALAQAWMSRIGFLFLAVLLLWLLLWYLKHTLIRQGPQIWTLLKSLYRSIATGLSANPYLIQFKQSHPRLMAFVTERLDRKHFTGLPLTLLSASLLYIAFLFGGIVEDFLTTDTIVTIDNAVAQLLARFRPAQLVTIFTWITALGISNVLGPLILVALASAWLIRGRWLAIAMLTSAGGTAVFTTLSKIAFHRPRPVEAVLLEQSYSFPSGHASIAVGFYGFIGYILVRTAPDLRSGINRLLLILLVILAIGLSRIMLGVHYISDVWAGYLIGAGWLVIGITISEWATTTGLIEWRSKQTHGQRLLLWLMIAGAGAWYVAYTYHWKPAIYIPPPAVTQEIDQPLPKLIEQNGLVHTETLLGDQSQPLSVAFIAPNDTLLIQDLLASGWQKTDALTPGNLMKILQQGMAYMNAPLAPVFWNGHINDLGLVRAVKVNGETHIDTLRVWRTHWRIEGVSVYVGVVRSYTGMHWGLLHQIAPDTDAAGRRLLKSLASTGVTPENCQVKIGNAEIGTYLLGMQYFSSGKLTLVDLRQKNSSGLCDIQRRSQ